jgi:catechol 2,3-dioxygenase-like lactoylglutathione lyase family enzyme
VATIDHVILEVNELAPSVEFYVDVMGFELAGRQGPFTVVRVDERFVLQLVASGTDGGRHLAFALSPDEFDAAFERVKARGIPFGDSFRTVGSGVGPGVEIGARGEGPTVYFFDPSRHLIEIRTYR